MKYLRKFETQEEYNDALPSLAIPNVSLIVSSNEVKYLPAYLFLEELTFTGNEYILTDIMLQSPNYRIVIESMDTDPTVSSDLRAVTQTNSSDGVLLFVQYGRFTDGESRIYGSAWYKGSQFVDSKDYLNQRIAIEITKNSIKVGTYSISFSSTTPTTPLPFSLGTALIMNADGTINRISTTRAWIGHIYSALIYDLDDNLLHNLVPALELNSNTQGMLDMVNKVFYPLINIA